MAGFFPLLAGGWTPNALGAALLGAWDAERTDLITLSGSTVTSWLDTVAGYDASQGSVSARPAFSPSSFNGRPGIAFDGSDDFLNYEGVGNFPTGATGGEIWALVDQTALVADTAARAILSYGGDSTNTARSLRRVVVTGANRARGFIGEGASFVQSTNIAVDFSGRNIARVITEPTQTRVNVNTVPDPTPVAAVPATGATRTRIGAITGGTASTFFQGVINYIAITALLSDDQATQMVAFLRARGDISG